MKTRVALVVVAIAILLLSGSGGAYSTLGPRWPASSTVVMHLEMGSSSTALIDGSGDFDTVAEGALSAWNPFMNGVSFRAVRDSSAVSGGNGINTVSFGDDVYGSPWGSGVLAITETMYSPRSNTMTETDVIFNRKSYTWNSYRGNLRSGVMDLRRVALHEFGHVIGLDHPDDHGQSVAAIMNSHISNVDSLQTDDTNGALAIYGGSTTTPAPRSNRAPTVTAGCNPCTVEIGGTAQLTAAASDPDGDALSYQWTVAQGSLTSASVANPAWTAPVAPGSVVASVSVSDGRGGSASSSVTLQVVLRDKLPAGARLVSGQSLISADGRFRLVYQSDGNFVLYDDVQRTAPWSSGTAGRPAGQAAMQGDGNFVIYDATNTPRWMSGGSNSNARLVLQTDGNIVVYTADGRPAWDRFSNPAGFIP